MRRLLPCCAWHRGHTRSTAEPRASKRGRDQALQISPMRFGGGRRGARTQGGSFLCCLTRKFDPVSPVLNSSCAVSGSGQTSTREPRTPTAEARGGSGGGGFRRRVQADEVASPLSFSVRIKRSATPLPSGSRTKLGELLIPKNAIAVENRRPGSSTRGRDADAALGWRRHQPAGNHDVGLRNVNSNEQAGCHASLPR